MTAEKLLIDNDKFEINLKFYFLLKYLVKARLSRQQSLSIIDILLTEDNHENTISKLYTLSDNIKGINKSEILNQIIQRIEDDNDLKLLMFSLQLYMIKDLLLEEAKIREVNNKFELINLEPLSLAYDNKSVCSPYTTRVNSALLSLLFFSRLEAGQTSFMSQDTDDLLKRLSNEAIKLKRLGLEPNQIFMLMFSESVNQSIISDSGANYEDRILSVLINMGISQDSIKKQHDKNDKSTEFDFFFELNGKTFGIGAKRTLRERYKQFIKTSLSSNIDVMIEVTLGLDLNEEKAKTIVAHGTVIFVADEVYESRTFLKNINGVYSVKSLNINTLCSLIKQ